MPFDTIVGQPTAVGTLQRMLRSGRVHHALRFEGPEGVGKRLAAMATAQALVCTSGDPTGCGTCSACERAVTLCEGTPSVPLHPDVIWIERGLYPPEAIGRRSAELQEISIDQIRALVLARQAFAPHEGRGRVFIVRRAEELSVAAANALLKTLEEPLRGTYFILTTSRPARLLHTIRSRTLRVRFSALPDEALESILRGRGTDAQRTQQCVALAAGSASEALELMDEQACLLRDDFLRELDAAVRAPDMVPALALVDDKCRDKALLREHLQALATSLATRGRDAALQGHGEAHAFAIRYEIVLRAVRDLEHNASPARLVEQMVLRLRAEAG